MYGYGLAFGLPGLGTDLTVQTLTTTGAATIGDVLSGKGVSLDPEAVNPGDPQTLWVDAADKLYLGVTEITNQSTPPSGPVGSVQFNTAGVFAGSANFTFDTVTSTLTVSDKIVVGDLELAGSYIIAGSGGNDLRLLSKKGITVELDGNVGGLGPDSFRVILDNVHGTPIFSVNADEVADGSGKVVVTNLIENTTTDFLCRLAAAHDFIVDDGVNPFLLKVDGTTGAMDLIGTIKTTDTTQSVSVGTGSIITAGGIGLAKNLYVGTDLVVVTGNLQMLAGPIISFSIVDSTSTATGAITTDGGVGIEKRLNVGGMIATESTVESTLKSNGSITTLGGMGIMKSLCVGDKIKVTSYVQAYGPLITLNATESTSTTTGAIKCSGGVGIVKNLHVGGIITVPENDISETGSDNIRMLAYQGDSSVPATYQQIVTPTNLDSSGSGANVRLSTLGSGEIFITASSRWYKTNIRSVSGIGLVKATLKLQGCMFDMKNGRESNILGLIAEDVYECDSRFADYRLVPEGSARLEGATIVSSNPEGVMVVDGLNDRGIMIGLIETVKSLQNEIDELRAIVEKLS